MAASAATRTESDRFERWLELIPHCNRAEEGIELEELAELFDDSAESVLADVQALVDREYYLPGSFADSLTILIDGERLDLTSPDHFQRPIGFSPLEVLALQLGQQVVAAESSAGEAAALEAAARELAARLAAACAGAAGDGEAVLGPLAHGPGLPEPAAQAFDVLYCALDAGQQVKLRYFKPHEPDDAPPRRVAPWALAFVRNMWYLLARDEGAGGPRIFRLDRIIEARQTEEATELPPELRVEEHLDPERVYRADEDDLEVAIRYSPAVARWVRERYESDAEPAPDRSVTVRHRCKSPWWAVSRALGYGAEACISRPAPVRALVMKVLRELHAELEAA